MARPHRLRTVNLEKFQKANWYMAHGYPLTVIAERLGVHRNTVQNWARMSGYTATNKDTGLTTGDSRTVTNILRNFRKLSQKGRSYLIEQLKKDAA